MAEDMGKAPEEGRDAQGGPVDMELLRQVLDGVRPCLQADGGDCRLVGVDDDGVVSLELTGACSGCPLSSVTLSMGVERILKQHVPGVTRVVSAMDGMGAMGGAAQAAPDDDADDDIPSLL